MLDCCLFKFYNKYMKNKLFKFFILILAFGCLMIAFAGCDDNDINIDKPVKSVLIKTKPQQYYLVNDTIDLTNGELLVNYVDGTSITVSFLDGRVDIDHPGTNIPDVTNTMRISYGGVSTTMFYTVTKTNKIESITVEGTPEQKYSVGSSIGLKNVKLVIKYVGVAKTKEVWLTSDNKGKYSDTYLHNNQIKIVGFNSEKVGHYMFNIKYLSSDFYFSYEVVKDTWITDVDIVNESVIKKDYFIGDKLELNGAQIRVHKSDGSSPPVNITADMISGFSTSVEGKFTMNVSYFEFLGKKLPVEYNVLQDSEIESITYKIEDNEANVYVGDNVKFNKSYIIVLLKDKESIKVSLSNSEVELTCEGKPFEEVIKTDIGRKFTIDINYKGHTSSFALTVLKRVIEQKILNAESIKAEYKADETFDFGDAKMRVTYDDGTYYEVSLQEQYALEIDQRVIGFMNKKAVDVDTFDMAIGEHSEEFYIKITGNGNTGVLGRYYINYTVIEE